jgi:tetratricopeptide (TPR) repeat protein
MTSRKHSLCLLFAAGSLLLPPALLSAAKTDKDAPAAKETPSEDTYGPASRIEIALVDISKDEEKLFRGMETGELSQDDFERRATALSYRYDELVSRAPNDINLMILYGKFLRRVGQNRQANIFFSHVDRLSPNLAVVKQQLGNYLAEEGNYPEALTYYLKAIELEPNEAVYHYGLGELLATFHDKFVADGAFTEEKIDEEALSAFAKAVELAPDNKDFAFRHAEAYYDLKTPRWEEALALWEGIAGRTDLTRYERDASRLHRARINCELGRNKAALELVRDEVTPVLMATRARLLKRINSMTSVKEDKANAEALAPSPAENAAPGK